MGMLTIVDLAVCLIFVLGRAKFGDESCGSSPASSDGEALVELLVEYDIS